MWYQTRLLSVGCTRVLMIWNEIIMAKDDTPKTVLFSQYHLADKFSRDCTTRLLFTWNRKCTLLSHVAHNYVALTDMIVFHMIWNQFITGYVAIDIMKKNILIVYIQYDLIYNQYNSIWYSTVFILVGPQLNTSSFFGTSANGYLKSGPLFLKREECAVTLLYHHFRGLKFSRTLWRWSAIHRYGTESKFICEFPIRPGRIEKIFSRTVLHFL